MMKRETAEKFVEAANKIDQILSSLEPVSFEIEDEAERIKIRRGMAAVFIALYEQLTREVVREYPDLHPDPGSYPA